jgi:hypothetical protein
MELDLKDQREARKSIKEGYSILSSRRRSIIPGDNTGFWGYLKKQNVLKRSVLLPNESKGIITCSHDEYMQMYMRSKRKKYMISQIPPLEQSITDLSINGLKSNGFLEAVELPKYNDQNMGTNLSREESLSKLKEEYLESEQDLDKIDLRLDGQTIYSEHDATRRKSYWKKKDIAGNQVQSDRRRIKKKRELATEKDAQEIVSYEDGPQIIFEESKFLNIDDDLDIAKDKDKLEKNTSDEAHDVETNIQKDLKKYISTALPQLDEKKSNPLVSVGSHPSLNTNSQLSVIKDDRLAKSSGGSRPRNGLMKSIWKKKSHLILKLGESGEVKNDPVGTNVSQSRRGSQKTSTAESRRGSQKPSMIESRRGSQKPSMIESRRGSQKPSMVESRRGSQMPSMIESRRGSQKPSMIESRRGSQMPSMVQSRRGSQMPSMVESRRGSQMPSMVESRRGSLKPFITESRRGSQMSNFGSSFHGRKSIKGDMLTGLLDRRMSLKGDMLRRKSIRIHDASIVEGEPMADEEIFEEIEVPIVPVAPPLGVTKVRMLWRWAFYSILRTNKLQNFGNARPKTSPTDREDSNICWSTYQTTDIERFLQIKDIFSKKKELISDDDVAILNSFLEPLPFFSKFPQDLRPRLYKELFCATYPKGKKLIKEACLAEFCYIMVFGETIQQLETSVNRTSDFGSLIGDFISAAPESRSSSVICSMQTTVLYLPKVVWMKYTREANQYEAYQLESLSMLNIFKKLSKYELLKICSKG